jgi:ankyrin repeat protein
MQVIMVSSELHRCAESGDLERVKQLVEGGANIEARDSLGSTALSRACLEGQLEIVVYLVEHGANVAHRGFEGKTPLHCACFGVNFSPTEGGRNLEVV